MNGLALFAGGGGLELGLSLALGDAYRCVCYVERDAYAAATLVARMEDKALDQAPIWDDVSTFDGKPWCSSVDLISGGFPCQDISVAGRREGLVKGNRSGLWFEYARIIGEVRPPLVFVENVSALALRGLDIVLGTLSELGFDAEWLTLGAGDVGAPHQRDRLFLLAHSEKWSGRQFQAEWKRWEVSGRGGKELAHAIDGGPQDGRAEGRGAIRDGRHENDGPAIEDSGTEVANPLQLRSGERPGWEQLLDCDKELADPQCCRRPSQRELPEREPVSSGGDSSMADAGSERLQGIGQDGTEAGPIGRGGRTEMEHSEGGGRPQALGRHEEGLRPFPPGPSDTDAWREIIEADPTLEPAICGMADGMAGRVDRLRLCGNGVVPIVAAIAFRTLAKRLGIMNLSSDKG